MYSSRYPTKPCKPADKPPLKSVRLLDQVRERIRYKHYSIRTEEAYVYWVRGFVRFDQLRHTRDMGSAELTGFLSWLAAERGVASSTHKQALSALLFLYREVLEIDLPWMNEILRPKDRVRVPTVLSVGEVARLFAAMEGTMALLARLPYGTGLLFCRAGDQHNDSESELFHGVFLKGWQGGNHGIHQSAARPEKALPLFLYFRLCIVLTGKLSGSLVRAASLSMACFCLLNSLQALLYWVIRALLIARLL